MCSGSLSRAQKTRQLAVLLSVYFSLHDRTKLDAVDRIARGCVYRRRRLDAALVHRYGYATCSVQSGAPCDDVHDLAVRLCMFFSIHCAAMLVNTDTIARSFLHDQAELNEALMVHYGCDLRF